MLQQMRADLEEVKEKLGSLADQVVDFSEKSLCNCTEDPNWFRAMLQGMWHDGCSNL